MKYLILPMYDTNTGEERRELVGVANIFYNKDMKVCVVVNVNTDMPLTNIPLEYSDYQRLLDGFRSFTTLELKGISGFNSPSMDDLDDDEYEAMIRDLIEKISDKNDGSMIIEIKGY